MRSIIANWASGILMWFCGAMLSPAVVTAAPFVPGHIYASDPIGADAVFEHDSAGHFTGEVWLLPNNPTLSGTHGVTFGPDGLLYAVAPYYPPSGNAVFSLDSAGNVHQRYEFTAGMSSIATGDIAFDSAGHFYVGAVGRVLRFTVDDPNSATAIWEPASYVYGVQGLPSGNLLVGVEFGVFELDTVSGQASQIVSTGPVRGIGYDPSDDSVLVSTIGSSATPHRLTRYSRTSGSVLDELEILYPMDVTVAPDRTVIVGSYGGAATLLDPALNVIGHLDARSNLVFSTVFVPEASAIVVFVVPSLLLVRRRRSLKVAPQLG